LPTRTSRSTAISGVPVPISTRSDPTQIVESFGGALYAKGCELNTWGSPPFLRLSRLPELSPFLILNLVGLAPETRHTAVIDMQVVSTGGASEFPPPTIRRGRL
jgi:hypothetical protein